MYACSSLFLRKGEHEVIFRGEAGRKRGRLRDEKWSPDLGAGAATLAKG